MTDKILHFMAGALFSMISGYLSKMPFLGLLVAILAGLAKEIYDIKHGTPEWKDFVATGLGGLAVAIILKVVS